uniref:CCHC-type domain-containing protein n=1 Tax=Oryza rufipogon TaxID=4529 RepID=A0A0E0RH08_ORYRU
MEVIIIVVLDILLTEVLLLWIGLLMIFTVTIGIVVLLVFRWMKGLRDGDGSAASKSVSFKLATPSRDGSKPAASSVSKSKSKVESTAASGSKSRSVECYTCGGRGLYMRDCPNQKKVLMTKEGYVSESILENSEGIRKFRKVYNLIILLLRAIEILMIHLWMMVLKRIMVYLCLHMQFSEMALMLMQRGSAVIFFSQSANFKRRYAN